MLRFANQQMHPAQGPCLDQMHPTSVGMSVAQVVYDCTEASGL
jgi:hypothetical protein